MPTSIQHAVSGCTQVLAGDKPLLLAAIMALFQCEEHGGAHHFAVVGEGRGLAISDTAISCLTTQGVSLGGS